MSAIITMLITTLGPILAKAFLDWINKKFNKVAPTVPVTGNDAADAEALVQAAIDATPRVQVFKRATLRFVKGHAAGIVTGAKLSKADKAELSALAAKAKSE